MTDAIDPEETTAKNAWLAYVVPMVVFAVFTVLEGQFRPFYPLLYIAKVVVVVICLWIFRSNWIDIRVRRRVILLALLVGVAVFLEWILLDRLLHYPHFESVLGKRTAYNPFEAIRSPALRILFLGFRFAGLVVQPVE